jgi:RNA polymerase sporulation-specific sigma factor
VKKAQQGDRQSRHQAVEANLGLVRAVVRRLNRRGQDPEDLFQIGVIGLMKAVDRFDFAYQTRFSTYAVPLIMGEIQRFLRDDGLIKVSRSIKEQAVRILQTRDALEQQLGQAPTLQEIAEAVRLPIEEISAAFAVCQDIASLSPQNEDDEGPSLFDHIPAPGPSEAERLDALCLRTGLRELSREEQQLIRLRYFESRTQTEVGHLLGLSQVQVSRKEKKILRRLRQAMECTESLPPSEPRAFSR